MNVKAARLRYKGSLMTLPLFDGPGKRDGDEKRDKVFRVSEINRAVRLRLESDWRDVWVEGELSDVTKSAAGHVYFTLCDETDPAQVRGVLFRSDAQRSRAQLRDGERVRLRGSLSLYEPRGSFQLIARIALPAGEGDLAAQFDRVRKKLEAEGLFDPARKRRLPRLPRVVGVVTSRHGAALHDIVRVARERCPVRIVVADCRVQGDDGARSVIEALVAIQRLPELDVVIVARGGGSAEDLWAFNDERLARAIATCRVPTVSGVGHEVDVTIADLVADVRAATPSNAAEIVCPDRAALMNEIEAHRRHLERAMDVRVGKERLRLERAARRLRDPRHDLRETHRRIDALAARIERAQKRRIVAERQRLATLDGRLARRDPRAVLARDRKTLAALGSRLEAALPPAIASRRARLFELRTELGALGASLSAARRAELAAIAARLDAMSPLAVLARGYAIALDERTGRALVRAADVAPGDRVRVRLSEGALVTRVEGRDEPEPRS